MTDEIRLTGLSAFGRHGVLDFEKEIAQPFVLDLALSVDLQPAGETDDLSASLSYADVAARTVAVCAGESVDLIETLAERVAQACLEWPMVEAVEVTVHKPHAPAGVEFVSGNGAVAGPSVTVRRGRRREVVIALGTNLGRRVATLTSAVKRLRALEGLDVVQVSPIVETDPVGGVEQPDYLNAVVVGVTRLTGPHLMRELHRIEAMHGRRRDVRWGARSLDLDLVQLGTPGEPDEVRCGDASSAAVAASFSSLALPHPRAVERAFVMVPWAEAAPWSSVRTPTGVESVPDVVARLDRRGVRPGPAWDAVESGLTYESNPAQGEARG